MQTVTSLNYFFLPVRPLASFLGHAGGRSLTQSLIRCIMVAAISAMAVFGSLPTQAEETENAAEAGRATLNGRVVILKDDGTWQYARSKMPGGDNCNLIVTTLYFCAPEERYRLMPAATPPFAALYQIGDRHFLGFIIEQYGSQAGLNAQNVRTAILLQAGTASNISPENINVVADGTVTANGREYTALGYEVAVEGVDVTFLNHFHVGESVTVQVVLWQVGHSGTATLEELSREVLENTSIDAP